MYDLNKINDCLNTKVIGRTIIQYDLLNSTHSKAKSIFATCPDGAVVLCEDQEKWRVRMGKEWMCYPEKNIYLSIILKPMANVHPVSKYDVLACASICEALDELYEIDSNIKWPNDIFVGRNKISSVSSSIVGKKNKVDGVIISLGINANINKEELNEEIRDKATSLIVETSVEIDREALIGMTLNKVERHCRGLASGEEKSSAVCIFNKKSVITGKNIEIIKKGKKTKRKVYARGIDEKGWLIVINDKGNEEILNPGETIITYEQNA